MLSGRFVAIEAPSRIVCTWTWSGTPADDGYESLVTVEFRAVDGTELVVVQERLPSRRSLDEHREGWSGTLDRLAGLLVAAAVP